MLVLKLFLVIDEQTIVIRWNLLLILLKTHVNPFEFPLTFYDDYQLTNIKVNDPMTKINFTMHTPKLLLFEIIILLFYSFSSFACANFPLQ